MIRWINNYIGTAAWNSVQDKGYVILDVRNLVDKGGNSKDEVSRKIDEGLALLKTNNKIIVCCDYGMSRSNSIAAGIIAKIDKVSFINAVSLVMEKTGETEIKISMLDTVQQALSNSVGVNKTNKKILVTGSGGFIGNSLKQYLNDDFVYLSSKEIDLNTDVVKLNLLCKAENIGTIIHLANPRIYTTSASFGQSIVMLKNVLDVCIQNDIKLIYPSTWEVYSGYKTNYLLVNEATKMNPGGTYGQSKMLCENLINHYVEELGLKSILLRFSPIYGLGADKPKCIWNFSEKAIRNEEINTHLYLNGLPTMDLLHIDDACSALVKALEYNGTGNFNVGSGNAITTLHLAETIVNILGSESKVIHTNLNLITHNITLDNTKVENLLGWKPQQSLAQGLKEITHFIQTQIIN